MMKPAKRPSITKYWFRQEKNSSVIVESPTMSLGACSLKVFWVSSKQLQDSKSLLSVNLSSSLIGDEEIKNLSDDRNTCLDSEELNLAENRFSRKGARRLAMNTSWKSLKRLDLSGNSLEAEGIRYIAENSAWTALQILLLKHVGLDITRAKALSANESWEERQELYLDENLELDDNGFMLLAHNNTWTKLQKLSISGCAIKYTGLGCWREPRRNQLERSLIRSNERKKRSTDLWNLLGVQHPAFLRPWSHDVP